jgi:hypothetical protein
VHLLRAYQPSIRRPFNRILHPRKDPPGIRTPRENVLVATENRTPKPGSISSSRSRESVRLGVPEADASDYVETRSSDANLARTSLLNVRRIYVECKGEQPLEKELCNAFTSEIGASQRFRLADSDYADAALKVSATVERTAPVKQRDPGRRGPARSVTVLLVNVGGEIIWQMSERVEQGREPGFAREVAAGVLSDLQRHIQELEKIR